MAEKTYSYDIDGKDLHEFFRLHNQLDDRLEMLTDKVELLHVLQGCCVELEAYNNKNYNLLCTAIGEALDYAEELTELSGKCYKHMQNMLKK